MVDVFQGATLNGSRDDFRRFVILVGTQLGYGDLAQSMSESLDVNRKMADEYMHLRDVATSWKQKAKTNSKDARAGRRAQEELSKAQGDIAAILEEREIFIQQRHEFLAKDDQLTTKLNRVHKDYSNAIEDNTKLAANVDTLEQELAAAMNKLNKTENLLSMAEHHRNKAEVDCEQAIFARDKAVTDQARDKAFATPSGRTWNSSKNRDSSSLPARASVSPQPFSWKSPTTVPHPPLNASYRLM